MTSSYSDNVFRSGITRSEIEPLLMPPSPSLAGNGMDVDDDDDDELPRTEPHASYGTSGAIFKRIISQKFPRTANVLNRILLYIQGPSPPIVLRPTPLLDRTYSLGSFSFTLTLETRWRRLTSRFAGILFFCIFCAIYLVCISLIVRANWYNVPADAFIGCTATFWSAKNGCGLNGDLCQPFASDSPTEFRCPASCNSVQLLNIRTVGDQEVVYKPLVVGGGDELQTFRGDSWICNAALQT